MYTNIHTYHIIYICLVLHYLLGVPVFFYLCVLIYVRCQCQMSVCHVCALPRVCVLHLPRAIPNIHHHHLPATFGLFFFFFIAPLLGSFHVVFFNFLLYQ